MTGRRGAGRGKPPGPKTFDAGGVRQPPYSAAVYGAIMPLQRVAAEHRARWGDRLPSLVAPAMAARFRQVYADLEDAMDAGDAPLTAQIAQRLITAWGVLEAAALDAGHSPLPSRAAFAIVLDDDVCVAIAGPTVDVSALRRECPSWIVYAADDAARILASVSREMVAAALREFPAARITRLTIDGYNEGVEDDVPF